MIIFPISNWEDLLFLLSWQLSSVINSMLWPWIQLSKSFVVNRGISDMLSTKGAGSLWNIVAARMTYWVLITTDYHGAKVGCVIVIKAYRAGKPIVYAGIRIWGYLISYGIILHRLVLTALAKKLQIKIHWKLVTKYFIRQ